MSVSGIGAAGYPVAGYETRRTERNAAGGNFAKQAAQAAGQTQTATLHGADEGSGILQSVHGRTLWADHPFLSIRHQTLTRRIPYIK